MSSAIGQHLPAQLTVFHWHGDTFAIPHGAQPLYRSEACENQGFIIDERVIGLQFHLEMTPTTVAELVTHAARDLIDGPFVQDPERLLAAGAPYRENQAALEILLQAWLCR